MSRKLMLKVSVIICLSFLFSLISPLAIQPVEAKTSRAAVIQEVKGTVNVKKAGGSKSFRAYKNMALNQGDHISTEARSSVVLSVLDHEDVITIDQNSDLYISELQENGGKKTKFSMWAAPCMQKPHR
jgi:hypothetical protein